MSQMKNNMVNVRLTQEELEKLDKVKKDLGVNSRSEAIRNIIRKSEIHVHYGQKEIMQYISKVHHEMNMSYLNMTDECQEISRMLKELQEIHQFDANVDEINRLASHVKDFIADRTFALRAERKDIDRRITAHVHF